MPKKSVAIQTIPTTPPSLTREEVKTMDTAAAVISRIVGADGKVKKGKLHELPLVSAVYASTDEMNNAIQLLTGAHRLRDEIKKAEEGYWVGEDNVPGLKTLKEDLIAVCVGADVPGFRLGDKAVLILTQSRKSFKQEKLIEALLEAGVAPKVIGESIATATVEGDPFYVVKLEELS